MKKYLLPILLLMAAPAWGQSSRFQSQVIGTNGRPLANQNVAVCTQPANTTTTPCSPLAILATSTITTSGGANPTTTDINGNFFFYAVPGTYTIQIYGPAIATPFVQPDVPVGASGVGSFSSLTVTGALNAPNVNKFIYIDGTTYPLTAAGVQSAIAAASPGNTVYVPCGTYTGNSVNGAVNINVQNVILQGAGRCTIFQNSSLGVNGGNPVPIINITANGVKVRDTQEQGQATDGTTEQAGIEINGVSDATVEKNYMTGTTGSNGLNIAVVVATGSSNFRVEDNEWNQIQCGGAVACQTTSNGYGVLVIAAGPGSIIGNRSIFSTTNGRHHYYLSQQTTHVKVLVNYGFEGIEDCVQVFAYDYQGSGAQYNEIIGNTCNQTNANVGGMIDIANNASWNKVIGNTINAVGGGSPKNHGIIVWSTGRIITITQCTEVSSTATCTTANTASITTNDIIQISGNTVAGYNNGGANPSQWQVTAVTPNVSFQFTDTTTGLGTGTGGKADASFKTPTENTIENNIINGVGEDCFLVSSASNNYFFHNTGTNCGQQTANTYYGMWVGSGDNTNNANNNQFKGNILDQVSSLRYSCYVDGATPIPTSNVLEANTCPTAGTGSYNDSGTTTQLTSMVQAGVEAFGPVTPFSDQLALGSSSRRWQASLYELLTYRSGGAAGSPDIIGNGSAAVVIGDANGVKIGSSAPLTLGTALNATNLLVSTTAPTIAGAGCGGTVAAIQNANGTASFEIFTGTAPTSAGCTVTFPAAAHHWICPTISHASAVSTTNFIITQVGPYSSTSVTFQLFSDVAAATAPIASDTWAVSGCHAN